MRGRKLSTGGFERRIRWNTHSGRIDGHAVERIRRDREASKSVLHPITVATTVIAVVTARRTAAAVVLAGTGAEDTTYDGSNNHKDSDWDANLEPVALRSLRRARGDVTGRFAVVRVPGAVWRSRNTMLCVVVVVICVSIGHVLCWAFGVFTWKETTTASE